MSKLSYLHKPATNTIHFHLHAESLQQPGACTTCSTSSSPSVRLHPNYQAKILSAYSAVSPVAKAAPTIQN